MHNTLRDHQTKVEYRESPLDRADVVVTVSHAIARIFRRRWEPGKIRTIYNPHDLGHVRRMAGEAVRHPWFSRKELPVVVGMGRLCRQKNFPLLVEAVSRLNREEGVPVRLAVFGDGPHRERLMRRIRKHGLQDRIQLMGWEANPFRYLARADLFVLSSDWEGLPNTLIEAMACGVPVISTDCESGPSEILQDGACGVLVPRGDAKGLAAAIRDLLINPEKARELGRRGQSRAGAFDVSVCVSEYERLILEGVEEKRRAARSVFPPLDS